MTNVSKNNGKTKWVYWDGKDRGPFTYAVVALVFSLLAAGASAYTLAQVPQMFEDFRKEQRARVDLIEAMTEQTEATTELARALARVNSSNE